MATSKPATPQPATPEPVPNAGGSYTRQADGSLQRTPDAPAIPATTDTNPQE